MYVGHLAIGIAIKARFPKVPALPIMLGVGFMDILDGIFIMLGLDRVTPNLRAGPYLFFDLSFIDWDHSLAAAIFWSLAWGALFRRHRQVCIVAMLSVLSHFLADWPMHNADLALYPFAREHLGLGLWGRMGTGAWVFEGVFSGLVLAYAWTIWTGNRPRLAWCTGLLALLFIQLSPWLSPMKYIATLGEPVTHLLHGLFVTSGFLIPGLILSWLLKPQQRHSEDQP